MRWNKGSTRNMVADIHLPSLKENFARKKSLPAFCTSFAAAVFITPIARNPDCCSIQHNPHELCEDVLFVLDYIVTLVRVFFPHNVHTPP